LSKSTEGFSKMALIIAVAVVCSLGGGIGSWLLLGKGSPTVETGNRPGNAAEKLDPTANAIQNGGAVLLDSFLVNLADDDAARYLRLKVSLLVDDKTGLKQVTENVALQMKIRDVIVQTLTQKSSKELMSEAGKKQLRAEIHEKIAPYFRNPKLVDVLFTDFVIQL